MICRSPGASKELMPTSESWHTPRIKRPMWWRPPINLVCLVNWRTSRAGEPVSEGIHIQGLCFTHTHFTHHVFFHRLSLCEKALTEYLDTKRLAFPRFYFISSADLLDILSNGTNPHQVATLISACRAKINLMTQSVHI